MELLLENFLESAKQQQEKEKNTLHNSAEREGIFVTNIKYFLLFQICLKVISESGLKSKIELNWNLFIFSLGK